MSRGIEMIGLADVILSLLVYLVRGQEVEGSNGKYFAGESIKCSVQLAAHRLGYSVVAAIWQREGLRSAKRDRAGRT